MFLSFFPLPFPFFPMLPHCRSTAAPSCFKNVFSRLSVLCLAFLGGIAGSYLLSYPSPFLFPPRFLRESLSTHFEVGKTIKPLKERPLASLSLKDQFNNFFPPLFQFPWFCRFLPPHSSFRESPFTRGILTPPKLTLFSVSPTFT